MHFDWVTLALQTVNFAALVWLLQHFLYRPVLRIVDARRAELDRRRSEAEQLESASKQKLTALERERTAIAAERAAVLSAAATEAKRLAEQTRAAAEREAAALIEQGHRALELERRQALQDARRASLDLGVEISRRLLADLPQSLRAEAWVQCLCAHLESLPATERDALRRQLALGAALRVVTAAPLAPESAAAWRAQLNERLGAPANVAFEVDRALVAGAELHFPNTVVSFSLRDAVGAIRAELERG